MELQHDLLKLNFDIEKKKLPKNIYGLQILDLDKKQKHDIVINHNGYCPNVYTEREQSNYNEYLTNLENSLLIEFEKSTNIRNYIRILEVMTNDKGELFHLSKNID